MSIDAMPYSQGWNRLALSPDVEFLKFNIANPDLSERGIPPETGLLDGDVHDIKIEQMSTVDRKNRILIADPDSSRVAPRKYLLKQSVQQLVSRFTDTSGTQQL
jgi:hypothetical protein